MIFAKTHLGNSNGIEKAPSTSRRGTPSLSHLWEGEREEVGKGEAGERLGTKRARGERLGTKGGRGERGRDLGDLVEAGGESGGSTCGGKCGQRGGRGCELDRGPQNGN